MSDAIARSFLFTSESVSEGHPDKICDQASDGILDAYLAQDPDAKVACECATSTGILALHGEITSKAIVDHKRVARETVLAIGFDHSDKGFDGRICAVMDALGEQSKEIAEGVHIGRDEMDLGAGDQGLMFGYATDETEELMPATCVFSHKILEAMSKDRKVMEGNEHAFKGLRPDAKSQVTIQYDQLVSGKLIPRRVHTVVISTQHDPDVPELDDYLAKLVKRVIPADLLDDETIFHFNPSGSFVWGGPMGDAGLTGRKIIVDTYGGWGAHGGGAFSGKDPTKVDRSAAYAARWVAKSLVNEGLCHRCLVQVSYAIGISEPLSIFVDSYGSCIGEYTDDMLLKIVQKNFDLRPAAIIKTLDLKRPIYQKTAVYGHFGRQDPDFKWEFPKKLNLEI